MIRNAQFNRERSLIKMPPNLLVTFYFAMLVALLITNEGIQTNLVTCHLFPVVMTSTPRHASNNCNLPQPVEIKILMVWLSHKYNLFPTHFYKIELDPAINLSVDYFKKILTTLMGQHLSLR